VAYRSRDYRATRVGERVPSSVVITNYVRNKRAKIGHRHAIDVARAVFENRVFRFFIDFNIAQRSCPSGTVTVLTGRKTYAPSGEEMWSSYGDNYSSIIISRFTSEADRSYTAYRSPVNVRNSRRSSGETLNNVPGQVKTLGPEIRVPSKVRAVDAHVSAYRN